MGKLSDVKMFVLDMDGTIYLGDRLFPYTRDFLRRVKETGRDFCFFTNNSSKNREAYLQKLQKMGIEVPPEKMLISNGVILDWLRENRPGQSAYVVGTPPLVEDFQAAGLPLSDTAPDYVVLGFDTSLTYEKLRLACDFDNIVGIKEASGNIEQMQRILDRRPEGFLVLSGDDGMAVDLMERGGDGVISVAANAFPRKFMHCMNLAKAGEFEAASQESAQLDEAIRALFAEGNPTGVKCALALMGRIGPTLRLPLVEASPELRERMRELIGRYDLR